MQNILIIANAIQTVEETLNAFKFYSDDPSVLEENNNLYLQKYLRMLPTVGGQRREVVDTANFFRQEHGIQDLISEHNSYALNGIHLINFLSAALPGWNMELIDNIDLESERARSLASWAEVVVFSTTFITSAFTITRVSQVLKSWNPRIKVIVGGAKLTQFAQDSELHEAAAACDVMIASRTGEKTLLQILECIERDQPFHDLPNLIYWQDGCCRTRADGHDGADINETRVRWDELPKQYLRSAANVRTGRGCPFKCKFCTFPGYNDQRMELKLVDSVMDELTAIARCPEIRSVRFVDDTLFLNRRQLIDVCQRMIDSGFDRPWTCYLRASTLTDECCRYLRDAGCRLVLVGIESADDTVLRNMSKGVSEANNWAAATNLAKYGIFGFAFILVGFPGETDRTVVKVIDFLNNSGIHGYVHSPMFIFPKSPVAAEAKRFNLTGGFNDWSHDTMTARGAIDACAHIFAEVKSAAYIDRGSSICKVLLDHGYSVDEAKSLALLHNNIARQQSAHFDAKPALDSFAGLSLSARGAASAKYLDASSPYSRTQSEVRLNAGARY